MSWNVKGQLLILGEITQIFSPRIDNWIIGHLYSNTFLCDLFLSWQPLILPVTQIITLIYFERTVNCNLSIIFIYISMYTYIYVYKHIYIYIYIYIYAYIYVYKNKKKKLLKVKSLAEVLAFGAYMFGSLRSFNNMYLYRFNCPLSNDCSLVTYANGRGSAVLTY